jgi:hypothetical protein
MKKLIYKVLTVGIIALLFSSCSKESLEPSMEQDKNVEGSITKAEDVWGILLGAYNRMTHTNYYGRDLIIYGEIRSDNAFSNGNSGRFINPGRMVMTVSDAYAQDTWTKMYQVVASCNILIGLDPDAIEGDLAEINHYIGQAYALRAMAHFDLLKLYGQQHVSGGGNVGIPYVKTYKGEDLAPSRDDVGTVKSNIESDLATSLSMMSAALNDPSHCYLTTWGAYALQARVALYFGEFSKVITACEAIINDPSNEFVIIPEGEFISSWFVKESPNSIFELAFSTTDNMNINGLSQIYRGAAYGDIQALEDLQSIFDDGDVRADTNFMIGPGAETGLLRNIGKYPSPDYSDNVNLIRYEEVILSYAEALIEEGRAGDALVQMNLITANRGAQPWTEATIDNVMTERRRELCFEGFRFDDLARRGMDIPLVNDLEQTHGGPAYGSYNYAFPIPEVEINANSNVNQNQGYGGS